jgi:hypothetical protein
MGTTKRLGPSKRKSGNKKRKTRNYSANEATLININALKKRVKKLEKALTYHDKAIKICYFELQELRKEPQP